MDHSNYYSTLDQSDDGDDEKMERAANLLLKLRNAAAQVKSMEDTCERRQSERLLGVVRKYEEIDGDSNDGDVSDYEEESRLRRLAQVAAWHKEHQYPIECDVCGSTVKRCYVYQHLRTKKHRKALEKQEKSKEA